MMESQSAVEVSSLGGGGSGETPRYKNLGFQGILDLALKANPAVLEMAAINNDLLNPVIPHPQKPLEEEEVSPTATMPSCAITMSPGESSPDASPATKGGKKPSRAEQKLQAKLKKEEAKFKQMQTRYKDEVARHKMTQKEVGKLKGEIKDISDQLEASQLEQSSIKKERELDLKAFEAATKKKEMMLKKLLMSKKGLIEENIHILSRTVSKNPGDIKLEGGNIKPAFAPLSTTRPLSNAEREALEKEQAQQQQGDFSPASNSSKLPPGTPGKNPALGKSLTVPGIGSNQFGGSTPQLGTARSGSDFASGSLRPNTAGSIRAGSKQKGIRGSKNTPDVFTDLKYLDQIIAPMVKDEKVHDFLDEFKRIDRHFAEGKRDRAEAAAQEAKIEMLTDQMTQAEEKIQKLTAQLERKGLEADKLLVQSKQYKAVASKCRERQLLEQEENDRARRLAESQREELLKVHTNLTRVQSEYDVYKAKMTEDHRELRRKMIISEGKTKAAKETSEQAVLDLETSKLQTSMLEDWRQRSAEFFREKYDYEASRIKKLQGSNRLLQNQIQAANAGFDRFCQNKF